MAQLPVMDNDCVQLTFKHNADELVTVKRVKREPGAVTAKNVMVLKRSDVATRDEMVFMPNTIEMAQLKKAEKGQFKTNVQISSMMTEMDIKRILVENFHFLQDQRFWCAAAVDNRTRLDFHGERRIWDGQAIKRKIKGNSALYIFTDEQSVDEQDPKASEQSTLKRSHDQITSVENEKSEQSSRKEAAPKHISKPSPTCNPIREKHPKLFPAGSSSKYVTSYPYMGPFLGATETATVKGTPTEGQLQKLSDIVAGVEGYVNETGEHGTISPVSHPSNSVSIQESRNAKDVVYTGAAPTSSHSMPMGSIMVPGGIVVAQPGMAQKIISTASDQQSLGKPMFHIADGHFEARHIGLPLVAHTVPQMVSSTLTPQMSNLNISKAASLQLQKPVDVNICAGERDQSAQTVEGGDLSQHSSQVLPATTSAIPVSQPTICTVTHNSILTADSNPSIHSVHPTGGQTCTINTPLSLLDSNQAILYQQLDLLSSEVSGTSTSEDDFTTSGISEDNFYLSEDDLAKDNWTCNADEQLEVSIVPERIGLQYLFGGQSAMEIDDDNQQEVSHLDGTPDLQNAIFPTAPPLGQGTQSPLLIDQRQEFNTVLPGSSTADTDISIAAPRFQPEESGQGSSSSDRELTTSGISDDDGLDSSEQDHNLQTWEREQRYKLEIHPDKVPTEGGTRCVLKVIPMVRVIPVLPTEVSYSLEIVNLGTVQVDDSMNVTTPPAQDPGTYPAILRDSNNWEKIAETTIEYVDEEEDRYIQKLLENPKRRERFFIKLLRHLGGKSETSQSGEKQNSGNRGSTQTVGSTHALPVGELQLLYVAAKGLLNSSAGKVIIDSYEESAALPEFVRNHGHEDTAHYLEDIITRISKQMTTEGSQTISELMAAAEAAQEQHGLGIASGEENHQPESDENSDYYGDVESLSCDSSEPTSDSEDDFSEMFSEVSVKEDEIQLEEDALENNEDENCYPAGIQSFLDSLESQDSEKVIEIKVTNSCLNECFYALKESVPKEQTSQLRPVTALSGHLMSFVNEGVFPRKQVDIKVKHQANKYGGDETYAFQIAFCDHCIMLKTVGHRGISFFRSMTAESIPRHLSTMCERWGIQLQSIRDSGEMTTHWLSILFHKLHSNSTKGHLSVSLTKPAFAVENIFVQGDGKLSVMKPLEQLHYSHVKGASDLESSCDDDFPSPNDEDSSLRWEAFDYPTEHCHSTASDVWVLTSIYRPTRKSLFVYVADSKDVLFPECFKDEDCELLMRRWKWQWCINKFSKRLKDMQKKSGVSGCTDVPIGNHNVFHAPDLLSIMSPIALASEQFNERNEAIVGHQGFNNVMSASSTISAALTVVSGMKTPRAQGKHGKTALMRAADQGHFDICKLLLEAGAKIDLQDDIDLSRTASGMGNTSSVDEIKLGDKIGDGAYGEVFKAVCCGKNVAAKRIRAVFFEGDYDGSIRAAFLEKFKTEWEILNNLKHPNIVQYYKVILPPNPETPVIVTELLHCDLAKYIKDWESKPKVPKVSFSEVVKIMQDVAEGLHYLHSLEPPIRQIVHRDLASKNVLLTKSMHEKMADMGLAKVFPHGAMYATAMPGTPVYAAPETYPKITGGRQWGDKARYTEKIDIFSFGALMLETIIGHRFCQSLFLKFRKTALMRAADHGHFDICKLLLEAGAKIDLQDRDGKTALMQAANHGHFDICKLLFEAGAKIDLQDRFGKTALMQAADHGHFDIRKLLLKAKAKIDLQDYGSSFPSTASTSQEGLENGASSTSSRKMKVTLFSSEWKSTKGGLSTINRELAIQLAKHPNVEVSVYLPQCSEENERVAAKHNVHLIEAEEMLGYDPVDWLASVPKYHVMGCVIGHGLPLGRQVPHIKRHHNCKWIQVAHTAPEELGMYKSYSDTISEGEKKHQAEVRLCKLADQVVAVGPKLAEAYSGYLRSCGEDQDVLNLTPGIFSEFPDVKQATKEKGTFSALVFGRGDSEDFQLKDRDIAAQAIAELNDMRYNLVFVGASSGEEKKVKEMLPQKGIDRSQLGVRCFKESREQLVELFYEADLAIMPSRIEGFGLAALEALSAGLPVPVKGNFSLGEALTKVPYGSHCVVESEDPAEWAKAVRSVRQKDRKLRLEVFKELCGTYAKKYNWEEQCDRLIETMMTISLGQAGIQASGKGERPLPPSAIPAPKQPRLLTDGHEVGTDTSVVKLLKAEYNRRAQLRPLLWISTIQLPLENVYTRLKIVSRRKADIQVEDDEVDMFDIFKARDKETLSSSPRGICLIINNLCFHKESKNRYGGEKDEEALGELFVGKHNFDIHVSNNLENLEMQRIAEEFAAKDHSEHDAFVCIIMSHGKKRDFIDGVKGRTISIEDLMMPEFEAKKCPTLAENPKRFIIQACGGPEEDESMLFISECTESTRAGFFTDSTASRSVTPQESDYLFHFQLYPDMCLIGHQNLARYSFRLLWM